MELSNEMNQRIEEASKDKVWAEKFRNADTWDKVVELLAEKGIEAPEELKQAFEAASANKDGKLEDDELEKVSGGWVNIFNCPQEYNGLLCMMTFCPNKTKIEERPDPFHYTITCNLYHWEKSYKYPAYEK